MITFVRALRCFRVLRLIMVIPAASMIISAMIATTRQLLKVCMIVLLGTYTMGSIGMTIFNPTLISRFDGLFEEEGTYANFGSTYHALQLMFIGATGDAWAGLLEETLSFVISDHPRSEIRYLNSTTAPNLSTRTLSAKK